MDVSKDAELMAKIRIQGIDFQGYGPEKFDEYIRSDMARLAPLLKAIADKR